MNPLLFPPLGEVVQSEAAASTIRVSGTTEAARAFYLTALALERLQGGDRARIVIVASTDEAARRFYDDLLFFKGPQSPPVYCFPAWDVAPLEPLSPSPKVIGERFSALSAWEREGHWVTVTSLPALAQKMVPAEELLGLVRHLEPGDALDRDELVEGLIRAGYRRAPIVENEGDYAVRGAVVDVFSPQAESPVRIEFDEDGVDSLRRFQVGDQRSVERLDRAAIVPAREVLLSEESRERAADRLRAWAASLAGTERNRVEVLADRLVEEGHFPGLETLLPLYREDLVAGVEALPVDALIALSEPDAMPRADVTRWEALGEIFADTEAGALPFAPEDFSLPPGDVLRRLGRGRTPEAPLLELPSLGMGDGTPGEEGVLEVRLSTGYPGSFQGQIPAFVRQLKNWRERGMRICLVAVHRTQAIRLQQILHDFETGAVMVETGAWLFPETEGPGIAIVVGRLSEGFQSEAFGLVVIREEEIFYTPARRRSVSLPRRKAFEAAFRNLEVGDAVVHRNYGIGLYLGVDRIGLAGEEREFLVIEYLGGDKLFVPMESLNLVQKYVGAAAGMPKLDRLGGTSWGKTKKKTKAAVLAMAKGLMKIAAQRQVAEGFSFSSADHWTQEFVTAFPYEETPDQLQAIQDVMEDMEKPRPMDRLVCGDVGFGKTEVAMRAAFKAVMDKKQVCILAPTTVLAEQHHQTFRERFAEYPAEIECITRFRNRAEQKDILERLAAGRIDVLIGTHRVLQSDVRFRDLGLLVVDEEQRFGVAHKEKLKSLRTTVDVLTLTATPIPRTLQMGLLGLRDLSVINTPPPDRRAVRTYVCQFNDRVIREALHRELERGGQVFFVHPRVETIEATARYLRRLVPELRLAIAHGQMGERQLHEAMVGFLGRKYDVLLCTTIIENGLDISNANTILVNRAEMYGLAQLYQLRGRVGRSDRQAYAYFLVQGGGALTETARRRLKALEELSELGAGFRLAAQDLEIRGAGNILGAEQSGQIGAVGFDLYCRLLEEAVEELKGESVAVHKEAELSLGIRTSLPEDYMPGQNQRLELYREIADAHSVGELDELKNALADRFGPLPPEAESLFRAARLRILAMRAGVEKLAVSKGWATFQAGDRTYQPTPRFLATAGLQFLDQRSFQLPIPGPSAEESLDFLERVLIDFGACVNIAEEPG